MDAPIFIRIKRAPHIRLLLIICIALALMLYFVIPILNEMPREIPYKPRKLLNFIVSSLMMLVIIAPLIGTACYLCYRLFIKPMGLYIDAQEVRYITSMLDRHSMDFEIAKNAIEKIEIQRDELHLYVNKIPDNPSGLPLLHQRKRHIQQMVSPYFVVRNLDQEISDVKTILDRAIQSP